jgi:uncharacterized protein YaaN involved in tellurite resistance
MTSPCATRPFGSEVNLCANAEEVVRIRSRISLDDRSAIASFGDQAQTDLARYADTILRHAVASDRLNIADDLGGVLQVVENLKPATLKQVSFLQRLFGTKQRRLEAFKTDFLRADDQVQRTASELRRKQASLKRDLVALDQLHDRNLVHLRTLEAHIEAGNQFLAECEAVVLPKLAREAEAADDAVATFAAETYANKRQAKEQLSRKVHDLKLSRVVALQTLPQIRLIQKGHSLLIDKLQSSLETTIPAWKSQMTIALALHRQDKVLALGRDDAEMAIDAEALANVNQALVGAVKDVLAVHQQSQNERADGEQELRRIDGELKRKTDEQRESP